MNPHQTQRLGGGDQDGLDEEARNPDRPTSMPLVSIPDMDDSTEKKRFQRISSPEKWELKQMMAANVIDKTELPDFDEETGILPKDDDSGMIRYSYLRLKLLTY